MQPRLAEFWEKAERVTLVLLAFALPVAFYLKTYDSVLVKHVTLQLGTALAVAFAVLRAVELGRLEFPANRTAPLALGFALLGWSLASFTWNRHPEASLFSAMPLWAGLTLFLLVLAGPASARFASALSGASIAAGGVAGGYAVLQALGIDPIIWKGAFGGPSFSTLANPDFLAVFSAAVLPLALARSAESDRRPVDRAASSLTALLSAASVAVSRSWQGAFALFAGAALYGAFTLAISRDRRSRFSACAGLALAAAAVVACLQDVPLSGTGLKGGDEAPARLAAFHRSVWDGAERMWAAQPVRGVGAGAFAAEFPDYSTPETLASAKVSNFQVSGAHSEPLQIAAELGAVGLALWLALLFYVVIHALGDYGRRAAALDPRAGLLLAQVAAVVALYAAGKVGLGSRTPAAAALFWLLAGSALGLALERGSSVVHVLPIPAPAQLRRALYLPVAALIAFVGVWQVRFFRSDIAHNYGVFHAKNKEWDQALERFASVSPWAPGGVMAKYFSGNVLMDRGGRDNLKRALETYAAVDALSPHYVNLDLQKGIAHSRLGEFKEAAASLEAYVRLRPAFPLAWKELLEVHTILGRKDDALKDSLKLVGLAPHDPDNWHRLSEQYRALGKVKTAKRMLQKAAKVHDLAGQKPASQIH